MANQHSKEIAHIFDEYGADELEIAHQLHKDEAERLVTGQQTIETVELPDSPPEEARQTPQDEPAAANH